MRQRNIGWRLDYVLAPGALASRAVSCPVQADVGTSDHAPVMATLLSSERSLRVFVPSWLKTLD